MNCSDCGGKVALEKPSHAGTSGKRALTDCFACGRKFDPGQPCHMWDTMQTFPWRRLLWAAPLVVGKSPPDNRTLRGRPKGTLTQTRTATMHTLPGRRFPWTAPLVVGKAPPDDLTLRGRPKGALTYTRTLAITAERGYHDRCSRPPSPIDTLFWLLSLFWYDRVLVGSVHEYVCEVRPSPTAELCLDQIATRL